MELYTFQIAVHTQEVTVHVSKNIMQNLPKTFRLIHTLTAWYA